MSLVAQIQIVRQRMQQVMLQLRHLIDSGKQMMTLNQRKMVFFRVI